MIVRIFKVRIHKEYKQNFERDFELISLPLVRDQKGLSSLSFGKVMDKDKDEYVLVITWESKKALVAFCREEWKQAVIPHGMGKYIKES